MAETSCNDAHARAISHTVCLVGRLAVTSVRLIMVCGLLAFVSACSWPLTSQSSASSLYERIGGMEILRKVSADFFEQIAHDPATRRTFDDMVLAPRAEKFAIQLCDLTGGPCQYGGMNMTDAHAGMDITEAEFSRTVAHLRTSLDRYVGEREKNEVLKLLAPMKREIVTGPFDGKWKPLKRPSGS